jgi:hypothetical protein
MLPMALPNCSVNQRLLSGPSVIPIGPAPGVMPMLNSVMPPDVVILPIWLALFSVNHSAPSGPVVIPSNPLLDVGGDRKFQRYRR